MNSQAAYSLPASAVLAAEYKAPVFNENAVEAADLVVALDAHHDIIEAASDAVSREEVAVIVASAVAELAALHGDEVVELDSYVGAVWFECPANPDGITSF